MVAGRRGRVEGKVRRGRPTAYNVYDDWCRGADRVSVSYGEWCAMPGTRALLEAAWAEPVAVVEATGCG